MEVGNRKQFGELSLDPIIPRCALALGTMAIAAGVERDTLMATGVALVQVPTQGRRSTIDDVTHHLLLCETRGMGALIGICVRAQNVCDLEARPGAGRWHHAGAQPNTAASGVPSRSRGLRVRPICSVLIWA